MIPAERHFAELHDTLRRRIVLLDLQPGAGQDLNALAMQFSVGRTLLRSVIQWPDETIWELAPRVPDAATIGTMHAIPNRFDVLGPAPGIRGIGAIDLDLHAGICRLVSNPIFLRTYLGMFFVTARMWVHFLPRLDRAEVVETFRRETEDWPATAERGDIRGLGYLIRNSLLAVLHRVTPFP